MLKKIGLSLVAIIILLALVVVFGPREPVSEEIAFKASDIGSDVDAYLAKSEAKYANIIPGAQKQVIWNDPATKSKTPLSIVYIHGFSATLEEVRPLPDIVAKNLNANLFYTRLSGHGRDGAAMAEPSVNDWLNDTAEAISVGRAIGEKVVIIATSTGGTFSAWAATQPDLMAEVDGIVFISPNFAINNPATPLLTMGAARYLLPPLVGAERSFEPSNEEHGKWWTQKYPTVAVLPMAQSVRFVDGLDYSSVSTPAMFVFHPNDKVVSAEATRGIVGRWGAKATVREVLEAEDDHNHVIAGRILSPSNSEPLAQAIIDWIKTK